MMRGMGTWSEPCTYSRVARYRATPHRVLFAWGSTLTMAGSPCPTVIGRLREAEGGWEHARNAPHCGM